MSGQEAPSEMSNQAILDEIQELNHDLLMIKNQLCANQSAIQSGEDHLDVSWVNRAATAKRFKTHRRSALNAELIKRNKTEKQYRRTTVDRAFVDVARKFLPGEVFFSILKMANSDFEQELKKNPLDHCEKGATQE